MQKPDADGYVNITWPSKNIPHGGLFHTRVAEPTEAQQAFLKGKNTTLFSTYLFIIELYFNMFVLLFFTYVPT